MDDIDIHDGVVTYVDKRHGIDVVVRRTLVIRPDWSCFLPVIRPD